MAGVNDARGERVRSIVARLRAVGRLHEANVVGRFYGTERMLGPDDKRQLRKLEDKLIQWELERTAKWADEGAEEYYSWQEKD